MVSPFWVVVFAIKFTITSRLSKGFALQFLVMYENIRCSILFHLLVPGGKWHTCISMANSVANFCNSFFHSLLLELLLPPPSAVTKSLLANGYCSLPMCCHQVLILFTANAAVSLLMPTLTQPSFFAISYTPYGTALPNSLSIKSCTFTSVALPFSNQSVPAFLKLPISSFFLQSTDITGALSSIKDNAVLLINSNCSFLSGSLLPSSVFLFACKLYPSDFNNSPTVT